MPPLPAHSSIQNYYFTILLATTFKSRIKKFFINSCNDHKYNQYCILGGKIPWMLKLSSLPTVGYLRLFILQRGLHPISTSHREHTRTTQLVIKDASPNDWTLTQKGFPWNNYILHNPSSKLLMNFF